MYWEVTYYRGSLPFLKEVVDLECEVKEEVKKWWEDARPDTVFVKAVEK